MYNLSNKRLEQDIADLRRTIIDNEVRNKERNIFILMAIITIISIIIVYLLIA